MKHATVTPTSARAMTFGAIVALAVAAGCSGGILGGIDNPFANGPSPPPPGNPDAWSTLGKMAWLCFLPGLLGLIGLGLPWTRPFLMPFQRSIIGLLMLGLGIAVGSILLQTVLTMLGPVLTMALWVILALATIIGIGWTANLLFQIWRNRHSRKQTPIVERVAG